MPDKLGRLIDNARTEMGPDVFRKFIDDLAGMRQGRVRRHICALCNGTGVQTGCMTEHCEGCDGTGRF